MACLWFHNPDRYRTDNVGLFWSSVGSQIDVTPAGFDGTPGFTTFNISPVVPADCALIQYLSPGDANFRCGGRYKVSELPTSAFVIMAITDTAGNIQVSVTVNADGTLSIYRGNLTALLRTSTQTITVGTFFRLGVKGKISGSVGEVEVHLDSTVAAENIACRVSSANTDPLGIGAWGGIYIGVAPSIVAGHLYANDGTGVRNNRLLPGAYVRAYPPTYSPSPTYDEWVPSEPTVDGSLADDDTTSPPISANPDFEDTVIEAANDGDRWVRPCGSGVSPAVIQAAVTIYAVQATTVVTNYLGDMSYVPIVVVEGATYEADFGSPGRLDISPAEWTAVRAMWENNPKTSTRWTVAKLTPAEFGGKRTA